MLTALGLFVVIFTVLANFFISYAVYRNNPRSATHILLATLSLTLTLWTIFNYLALLPGIESTRLLWVRVVMVVTAPFGPLLFLLASTFPRSKIPLKSAFFWTIVILTSCIALLSLTPLVFMDLKNVEGGGFQLFPGPGIALFGLNFLIFLSWGFVRLIKSYRKSTGILRKQFFLFLIGTIVTFSLITATNFIAVVVFGTIQLTFLGPPLTLIMVSFIGYAIVRHRFLDVRVIIARTLAYVLLVLISGFVYVVGFVGIGSLLFGLSLELNTAFFIQVSLTFLILASFPPLKAFLDNFANRIFFQSSLNQEVLLSEIGAIVSNTLDITAFTKKILLKVVEQFQIESGLFVVNGEQHNMVILAQKGGQFEDLIPELNALLPNIDRKLTLMEDIHDSDMHARLRSHNIYCILRFTNKDESIGYLLLGDKLSGVSYFGEELRLLEIIIPSVAAGLNNTLQFQEIQEFSRKLEKRVKDATIHLREANEQLKLADDKKNEFINMAAHELRAPLTAIKGFLSMVISGDTGDITTQTKEFLEDSASSTDRMIRLVNNMLNVSRIEEGRLVYNPEAFKLRDAAHAVYLEFQIEAERKQLSFTVDVEENVTDMVFVDQDKLHEVIVNFISNAIKYTEKGSIVLKIRNPQVGIVRLEVIDTGTGISKEEQTRLFQKFYRVEAKVGKTIGTGLGLYISKLLIEKFGGKIGVISGENTGSTFWFELPVHKGH